MNNERIWSAAEAMQGKIAAEIRVMLGEGPYDEKMFDDVQRQRRIEAMQKCAVDNTTDEERHESWMAMHREAGWVYGNEFDPVKKTHPNLMAWDQLPDAVKCKARIFNIVAKTAQALAELNSSEDPCEDCCEEPTL